MKDETPNMLCFALEFPGLRKCMEKGTYRNWAGSILATQQSFLGEGTVPEPNAAQKGADFFCQELSAVNSPQEFGTFSRPRLAFQ